jgi:hypothetical protein
MVIHPLLDASGKTSLSSDQKGNYTPRQAKVDAATASGIAVVAFRENGSTEYTQGETGSEALTT